MKVNNSSVGAAELAQLQKSKESKQLKNDRSAADRSAAANESAPTEISQRAHELAKAKAVATGAPEVREDLIADLKAKIASGKYNVSSEDIADRMVDEHINTSGLS